MTRPSGVSPRARHRGGRVADGVDDEALLAQPARQERAQLGIVLDDEQAEDRHSGREYDHRGPDRL